MKITPVLLLTCMISLLAFIPGFAQADAPPQEKEWTFITFLNGNNSLDRAGTRNIKEMEKVGSTDQINVVVQWASLRSDKTKRIYLRQGSFDTIEELDRVDMGDAKNFVEFVNWAVAHYPAKHYFIDLWNHGSGWHFTSGTDHLLRNFKPLDISFDDVSGHSISTEDLGKSLQQIARNIGHKIDIYGSDACLMAMAEVMGEAKNSVSVFVGCEEVEPDNGWPYGDLLSRWNENPTAAPADVAKILVEEYVKAYSGGTYGYDDATLSAVDLTKFENFETDFKQFTQYLTQLNQDSLAQVAKAARSAKSFAMSDYRDLGDFLRLLESNRLGLDLPQIKHLEDSMNGIVIANSITSSYQLAKGLSIWMPESHYEWSDHQARYLGLEFDKSTGWSQILAQFFLQD